MKRLYQKHHGLPGVAQIAGQSGTDGEGGNNIYFGYVSDFFNNIEMTVDNFVRIAKKVSDSSTSSFKDTSSNYYTGIFDSNGSDLNTYTDNVSTTSTKIGDSSKGDIIEDSLNIDADMNIFKYIYSDDYTTNYEYSYYAGDKMSWLYTKVDTAKKGNPQVWNVNTNPLWDESSDFPYPYIPYNTNQERFGSLVDFRPGKNKISSIDGFELFSLTSDNKKYTFSDKNDRYNDFRYENFSETNSKSDDPRIYEQTDDDITSMIQFFSDKYVSGENGDAIYDYIKYNKKAVETVLFADKLKDNIKAGDVLYFYTNVDSFELDHNVEYMVVITKELEKCTLNQLLAAAKMTNPFSFKYTDIKSIGSDEYVTTSNGAVCVSYDSSTDVEINGKNFANMISYATDSVFSVGRLLNDGSKTSDLIYFGGINNSMLKFSSYVDLSTRNICNKMICVKDSDGTLTNLPLKISNMFVDKNNFGNFETTESTMTDNVCLDSYGYCYTLVEDDYNYLAKSFTVSTDKLVTDTSTDFEYGAIVVSYDNSSENLVYGLDSSTSKVTKYMFSSSTNNIQLGEDFNDNTTHNIMLWVQGDNGIRYYSKHTLATFNADTQNYDIAVLEDGVINDSSTDDEEKADFVIFSCSGLSANATDTSDSSNIPKLDIFVKGKPSINVYANTHELGSTYDYSNSWCTLSNFHRVDYASRTDEYKHSTADSDDGYDMYEVNITVADNIPQFASNEDTDNVKDYNANPGISIMSDGCDLFNALMKGQTIKTNDRSITITVKFQSGSKDVKSYYKLIQPGFIDNRKMPKVNLSIKNDLDSLERSNDIDNGILCNQLQFFVDIDISDFDKESWGSYVPEENITLNFDITNTPVDYEFVERYGVQSAEDTYTLHVNPVDNDNDFGNSKNPNYFTIKTYLVNNDIVDPYSKTAAELTASDSSALKNLNDTTVSDNIRRGTGEKVELGSESDNSVRTYNFMKKDMFVSEDENNVLSGENATRDKGIDDNVLIRMRNITFTKANNGKFRFRVVVEFGNPVFSRLFFRYYVSNMYVSYKKENGDISYFYAGTSNLASAKQTGRYQTYDYMFATNTFNAFICPISFTAVPEEDVVNPIDIAIKTTGSDKQLSLMMNAYAPKLSSKLQNMSDTEKLNYIVNRQYIPWYDFNLKKRYLQDNVKNIYIQPIHISDYKDKLAPYELFNIIDGYDNVKSSNSQNSYLSVVYNSNMYNIVKSGDDMKFYFNNKQYTANKYAQYANNAPVYLSENLSYEVRDSSLMNSISTWNLEYQVSSSKSGNTFSGHLSTYGNGYEYLSADADKNQYDSKKIFSLADTKEKNEDIFFSAPYIDNIQELEKSGQKHPDEYEWFRQLVYQVKWQYPKYYTDDDQNEKVDAYDIVDNGEYLQTMNSSTLGKSTDEKLKYELPYNIMYSLYPRCAYDDETDTTIVFMLRCPSVVRENQYNMVSSDVKFTHSSTDYEQFQLKNEGLNVSD